MTILSYRQKNLPKTLGTKVNRNTYQNFQEEAENRGLSESQLLRVIVSEIITLYQRGLLIIPKSGMRALTELSCTLGTKVPLETYMTFYSIAKTLRITQSNLLRFGISAYFQNDNSFSRIKANPLNASINPQEYHRENLNQPQENVINNTQFGKADQTVTGNNWIQEMQKRAASNLALGYHITQFAGVLFLLLSQEAVGVSRSS